MYKKGSDLPRYPETYMKKFGFFIYFHLVLIRFTEFQKFSSKISRFY